MNITRKIARLWLRMTALVVMSLFSVNSLVWADPDVFLQPPLYTWCANGSDRIEVALAVYLRSLGRPIEKIDFHFFPTIKGKRVDLFFDSPSKRREGDKWIVPALVDSKNCEAVIDAEFNITLRDVPNTTPSAQAKPLDLSAYSRLMADTARLAAVDAVFSDLDGVDKDHPEKAVGPGILASKERLSRGGVRLGTITGRPSAEAIKLFGGNAGLAALSATSPYLLIGSTGGEGLAINPDGSSTVIDTLGDNRTFDDASSTLLKNIVTDAIEIAAREAFFPDECVKFSRLVISPKCVSVRTKDDPRLNSLRPKIAKLIKQKLSELPEASPLRNLNVLISAGAVDITISNKGDAAIRMIKLHKLKSVVLAADSVGTALEPGNDRSMLALTPEILKAADINWPVDLIRIYVGKEENAEIPEGVIIAPQGNKETDPAIALYGAIAAAKEKKRSSLDPANIDVMSWAGRRRPIKELTWDDREEVALYFRGLSGKFHLHLRPSKWPDAERLKSLANGRTPSEYYNSLSSDLDVSNSRDFSTDAVKFMHVFFDKNIPGAVWFDQIDQAEDIAKYVASLLEKDPAKTVTILDYGTANGEEALSLAVMLDNRFREKYPTAKIVVIGRDLQAPNAKMLNWIDPDILPKEIAPNVDRYFTRIGDTLIPRPETLAMVTLSAGNIINIAKDTPAGDLPADAVIINNVLGAYVKIGRGLEDAIEAISGSLAPGGRLYVNNSLYRDIRNWSACNDTLKKSDERADGLRKLTNEIYEKKGRAAAADASISPAPAGTAVTHTDSSTFFPTAGTLALAEELSRNGRLSIRISGSAYTFTFEAMPFWGAGPADNFRIRVLHENNPVGLIDTAANVISSSFDDHDAPALFLETGYRDKGLGRALLALAMGVSRNKGYNEFHVIKSTPQGEGMYTAMGFTLTNENKYGNDYLFDMTKPLPTVWSRKKSSPNGSPCAVFELMINEQGDNKDPVIFEKNHIADTLGRKRATIEPDLRILERLGLVVSKKKGLGGDNVYRLNSARWDDKADGPGRIIEMLDRYGYKIPESKINGLSSEIRSALGETNTEPDDELVASISSKSNPTAAYTSRVKRAVKYIWNNEGWASRQDLAGHLGCDIGTIGDDLKTVSLSKLKEASLARGMPVPVFFDKKIQREKWQRIVAIAESRLWCVSLDELGRALELSTSGNFTVERVFSPCVDRKDVEVLLRDINHNRRLRPQIKDRFSIEVIFSKEEKELRDKVITGLEALGGITTTRELSNLIDSGDRSVSSAVKKLDFRNINCKRAAMGMTPVIAPVDPRTIRSLNEIIYAMESLGGVATAAQLAKYTGQRQSYTTRLVSEMKENGIFTYLNAIRKQQNKFPLLIAREYPFDINGLVYVRSVLTNSGFYRADGTSSDSLALYKSFFGATGLDIFRDIVLPLTSRTITTNKPSSGTGNRANDELLRSKLLDDIIAIAIIYARDKGLGEAGTTLRGAVRRNVRLINYLKFAVPRAINTSGHSFVAYTNGGPPISTTKGYHSSLSSQTNKVPLREFINNLEIAFSQTEKPLKYAFSRDEELIRGRNVDAARARYIELGERDARMFESGRVLPRSKDKGSLNVTKVPPDGSPWKIASLLRDDFRRSGATPAQIASGTKGRGDDGHLTAETILRDLNTLISFNLVTKEETDSGTLYRFTKLSDGEWGAIEPILMRLGDRPTSAIKDAAKANIKLSVQRLGKNDDADPELSPLGGSPEKITDVAPLIKRIEEEVKAKRRVIVLVDGDPGTGKTSIIAAGIRQRFSRSRVISLDRYVEDGVRNGLHTQDLYADLAQAIGSSGVVVFEGPNLQFAINAMRDLYAFLSEDFIGDTFINTVPICVRASSESDSSRRFFVHRSSENEEVKNNRLDCRQRLDLQYGYDFHFVRPAGGNPALEPRPRMGKRAKVVHIAPENERAVVAYPKGNHTTLELVPRGDMPITSLIEYVTAMNNVDQEHKEIIIEMLNIMKALSVKLFTFEELIKDLHGFASLNNNLIAVHTSLSGVPTVSSDDSSASKNWIFDDLSAVALTHEIGEYLAAAGFISLSLKDNVLNINMNGHDRSIKLGNKAPEALTIAKKDPASVHYLLRAGGREVFGQKDADLTKKIKKWSLFASHTADPAGEDEELPPTDWTEKQQNIPATDKLTVKLDTHFGRITVLEDDVTSKRAVKLRVVKASDLTDEGRKRAALSLLNWLNSNDPVVTYIAAVDDFITWLDINDQPKLSKLLFVLSENEENENFVEGWVDLSSKQICLMEIAPWNKTPRGGHKGDLEKRVYKGMDGQLRALALKILLKHYGQALFSAQHIGKVIMLGEREQPHDNLFVTADRDTVMAYIRKKDAEVARLRKQLGDHEITRADDSLKPTSSSPVAPLALETITNTPGTDIYEEKWKLYPRTQGEIKAKMQLVSDGAVKVEASALITEQGITVQYQAPRNDRLPSQTHTLRRLFARAREIAIDSHMNPKWAFVYVISGSPSTLSDMEGLPPLMAHLGFASRWNLSSDNPKFTMDDALRAIISRTMPPGIMADNDHYWAMPLEPLSTTSVKKLESTGYKPHDVRVIVDRSDNPTAALTDITKRWHDPTDPNAGKNKPAQNENPLALRDLRDKKSMAECLAEEILSMTINKKVVLAFDNGLAGGRAGGALSIFEELKELKKNKKFGEALNNLEIVIAPASDLAKEIAKHSSGDPQVFLFAPSASQKILETLEAVTLSSYIDEEGFENEAYYPLAEIVAISLAQLSDNCVSLNAILKVILTREGNISLNALNIESVTNNGKTLIFKLLPNAAPCTTPELIQHYATIKRFLKAA